MADKEHEEKEGSHGHGHGGGGHHGGGHEEGHEGAPEWLISFADNVTLMMGFFVILLAMTMAKVTQGSNPGAGKKDNEQSSASSNAEMLDLAIAIREAFHNPVDINSSNPNELPLIKRVLERAKEGFTLDAGIVGNKHEVSSIRPTNYRKPAGAVSFEANSAELNDTGRQEATRIAKHFTGVRTILELRGHASAEEAFNDVARAMKLSFDRALAVAQVLVESGIDWRQIRIVACKDNDRLKPLAYDRAGQRENERVEVFPTDQVMPVYAPDRTEESTH